MEIIKWKKMMSLAFFSLICRTKDQTRLPHLGSLELLLFHIESAHAALNFYIFTFYSSPASA